MALLRRKTRAVSGLLTCVLSAEGGLWRSVWVGDGVQEPPEFEAASLTDAASQAAAMAFAVYAGGPQVPGAELQLAIYPWDYGKNGAIYDISGSDGQFAARDMQGSDREISGPSLEALVEALGREPGGDKAMLRWGRPVAELLGGV